MGTLEFGGVWGSAKEMAANGDIRRGIGIWMGTRGKYEFQLTLYTVAVCGCFCGLP